MVLCVVTPQVWVVMSKVLLVCKEPSFGNAIAFALENLNIKVTLCHDGDKAIEILSNEKINLLITEILLPYFSGIEVINRFLEYSTIDKVLILSTFSNYNFLKLSLKIENLNNLVRPYDPNDILKFIQSHESN